MKTNIINKEMFANFATKKQPVQFAKKLKMEEAEPKDDEDLQKIVSCIACS